MVHINSKEEDDYVKGYLINFYPDHHKWRTGGKKEDDRFVWYYGSSKPSERMNYTKWAPGQPGKYSTQILSKYVAGKPQRFVWKARWAGSATSSKPTDLYPFICEATPSGQI